MYSVGKWQVKGEDEEIIKGLLDASRHIYYKIFHMRGIFPDSIANV